MTGWPRFSDNFCPKMRAMMSLPPPAAKPTMMWIGRVGYFAGSSCAKAGVADSANSPRQAPSSRFRPVLFRPVLAIKQVSSEPRDMNMQHGRFAVDKRGQCAIDRGRQLLRLADAFAKSAERLCNFRKIP